MALKCKGLAEKLVNYDHTKWKEDASKVCTPGIGAKFHQNPRLMSYLQSTGSKKIVEATFDNIWGTGIPLHSKECQLERKWESIRILGEILMKIRDGTDTFGGNNSIEEIMDMTNHNRT